MTKYMKQMIKHPFCAAASAAAATGCYIKNYRASW